jgi:DNA-binding NarL/FixJ family response regulator
MVTGALSAQLEAIAPVFVVARVANVPGEFITAARRHKPDVVTIALDQLGAGDTEAIARLKEAAPDAQIVALAATEPTDAVLRAVRGGVTTWLLKDAPPSDVAHAVLGAVRGEARLAPRVLGAVLDELLSGRPEAVRTQHRLQDLSAREFDVLQCLVDGKGRDATARTLFVSSNTVRTHTQRVFAKLGVHSSLEAVAVAMSAGLRPRPEQAAS